MRPCGTYSSRSRQLTGVCNIIYDIIKDGAPSHLLRSCWQWQERPSTAGEKDAQAQQETRSNIHQTVASSRAPPRPRFGHRSLPNQASVPLPVSVIALRRQTFISSSTDPTHPVVILPANNPDWQVTTIACTPLRCLLDKVRWSIR